MIGFAPYSPTSIAHAMLQNPIDSLKGIVEAVRGDPEAFTKMPAVLMTRLASETVAAKDAFRDWDPVARSLRFFRRD
jgi:hypothetical protein